MRNVDRFGEAFGHMEHRVMGRALVVFTLRHRFWLEALGSPLVTGGPVSLLDLELAARLCAIPYGDLDRRWPRVLERGPRWWEKLGYLWRVWRRRAGKEYLDFQGYLMDHGCPPATFDEGCEGEGDESALPGVLGLVTGLMRGTGWEPATVWGLPPGEAEWYLAGVFLHRGVDVGIKKPRDESMEEMLLKRKALNLKHEILNEEILNEEEVNEEKRALAQGSPAALTCGVGDAQGESGSGCELPAERAGGIEGEVG